MKIWGVYEVLSLQSPSLLCLGFQQYVILISSNIPRCPSHKNLLLQCTPWVVQTAFVLRWWFLTDHVSVDQMPQGWPSMWAVPRLLYLTHVGDLGIIETKVKIKNQAKRKEQQVVWQKLTNLRMSALLNAVPTITLVLHAREANIALTWKVRKNLPWIVFFRD